MKKIFVVLVAVFAIFAQDAFAQEQPKMTEEQKAAAKAKRELLMQARVELLKAELKLTDEEMTKFEPIYRRYRQEINRVTASNKDARMKKELITNENALRVVSARLSNQILTATVKQNYLFSFSEVITPLQLMKLYQVDEKVSREAHKVVKYRQSAPVK